MRVVLDTNVLISGLLWAGAPAKVLFLARQGRIQSVTSPILLEELQKVLRWKLGFDEERIEALVEIVTGCSQIVVPRQRVREIQSDPDDDRVLECALEGKAEAIITGDNHLLERGPFQSVPIVTPREFLGRFQQNK